MDWILAYLLAGILVLLSLAEARGRVPGIAILKVIVFWPWVVVLAILDRMRP